MIKLFNERALATVAQSVEQLIRNQQVAGSSPASSSKKDKYKITCLFLFEKPPISSGAFILVLLFAV